MVSRFGAPPVSEDELVALFAEAERRGINIGPALALAASPEEAVSNIKVRLASEARPEVQQVRENVRANYPLLAGGPERATPQEAFYGAPFKNLGPAIPFTQSVVPEPVLKRLPDFLEEMTRQITTPFGLATAPFSPQRTVLAAGGSVAAPRVVKAAGGGETAQAVAEIAGGVIAGGPEIVPAVGKLAVRGTQAVGRGGAKLAEEVGKTNVGNVMLPRAPKAVAKPLIYENLHPVERQLYGIESKGRLTPDEVEGARDYLYGRADPATGARPGGAISAEDTAQMQAFEERYRGTHQLADRRREVARVLAKYAEPETPKATGPIVQAGFGGEMGPGQVARGAAEQPRMTQAPLSEVAASEADRIAKARAPISREPVVGTAATPPFAPTGAVPAAVVTSPPVATPPRSVPPPPAQPPVPPVPPAAVPPPTTPPVPPAGIPPSQPPLMPTRPSGIEETLKQAKAIVERDRPGITSRLMDYVPGVKQILHRVQPALDQPETMTAGWVGEGLAKGKVETSLQKARIDQLARLDEVFGKGAISMRGFKPEGITFIGTPAQRGANTTGDITGTVADIMERPALYDMSAEQRAAITATHNERSLNFRGAKADYDLAIGEHPVQPGGVHIPSVGVGEDDIEIAGSLENALRRGRAKTRIYPTLADRMKADAKFQPETNVSKLFAADDDTLATLAGRKVLVEGMGGKTRLQVMQETHPQLATQMAGLQTKLASLRATAARIGGEQAEAIDNFMQSPLDPTDLATLQADLNPRVGANAVGRQGPNFGKDFKALKSEVAAVKAQIATLRPAWENANLKPYVFVEDGIYRYFPVKEAKQAKNILKTSESKFLRIIDNLRATAFGGDFSPVTIQGVTAWFSDPIGVSRFVAQGKGGLSQASVLADMKANPASWQRFTAATGINPLGGIEKEFSAGYLGHSKLGKLGKGWKEWNEALYRPITKLQKDIFDNSYDAAIKHGLGAEQASAVAADDATKIIPRSNFRRLGQSTRDAARYRAALTSVSFLTQPVALMNDATKGLVKVGTKQTLTRSEVFAVKRVLTLVAATEAIAITSNVYHAQTHNLDIEQAVRDSLNPNSGKFMSLVLPNGARIGLGGPFRSIIHAVAPRDVNVAGVDRPIPMPFAGIERFAKGKMGPVARITYDEIRNKDYYGKPIRTENFPVNILQGIEYALEGSAPLTVGSGAQQLRKGESIGTVAEETVSQFAGTNLQPDDPAYAASLLWKKDTKPYFDIPSNAKEAKDKNKTTRTDYRRKYPQVEAKLFIAGDVESLSTDTARREAVRLMKEHNIAVADIDHLAPKDYESDDHAALRRYLELETGLPKDKWAKPGKGASLAPKKPSILR